MEFKREKYLQLLKQKDKDIIKVITGIRRSGKSYLLFTLFDRYLKEIGVPEDHIIKIALDDMENIRLREKNALYQHIKGRIVDNNKYFILLDE